MPPFITVTVSVRGFDGSRNGTVTRSPVSCPRSSVPSAAPTSKSLFFIFLLLPILDQYIPVERFKAQLRAAAADADTGHAIPPKNNLSIHVLRRRRFHRERRHRKIGVHAAIKGFHLHVRVQTRAERHIQRSVYRFERRHPSRVARE